MNAQTTANGRPVAVKQLPEKFSVAQGRAFFRELESCLNSDRPRIVLDGSRLQELDSAGIHVLLRCLEEAMKRNGDVKLAALPARAAATLELTGVHRLFESFDTAADAVDSFHQLPLNGFQHALGLAYSAPQPQPLPKIPPSDYPQPLPKVPRGGFKIDLADSNDESDCCGGNDENFPALAEETDLRLSPTWRWLRHLRRQLHCRSNQ